MLCNYVASNIQIADYANTFKTTVIIFFKLGNFVFKHIF